MKIFSTLLPLLLLYMGGSLETVFTVKGTVECQAHQKMFCYDLQLLELDNGILTHDIVASLHRCRGGPIKETFWIEGFQTYDGIADENYEVGIWVRHNCGGQEIAYLGSLGQVHINVKFWRKELRIDMSKHTIGYRNWTGFWKLGGE